MVMSSIEQTQGVFIAPHKEKFEKIGKAIAKALKKHGIELTVIDDEIPAGSLWIVNIQRTIERADFIIADITDENSNVMYEVGFAHALRKPVLPIVNRKVSKVPYVIAGYIYLVYDPENLDGLNEEIQYWALRNRPKGKQTETQPRSLAERAQARFKAKKLEQSS